MPEYTAGCLSVVESGPTTTNIGVNNFDFPSGAQVSADDSGGIYDEFHSVTGLYPVLTATSKCVAELLGIVGINGVCIGADRPITQVDAIFRKMETCQTALGSTPHLRHRITTGLIHLGTLTADRGADATLTTIVHALTDGTLAPVAPTDGVAMPSGIVTERLELGAIKLGNVVLPDIEGISIDFGVGLTEASPALSSIWRDTIGVAAVQPMLRLRDRDLSKVTAALLAFSANNATHANTLIQLKRRANGGALESFASTVHTSITLAGLVVPETIASAAAKQRGMREIRVPCRFDGTNAPILFNTGVAYDTTP